MPNHRPYSDPSRGKLRLIVDASPKPKTPAWYEAMVPTYRATKGETPLDQGLRLDDPTPVPSPPPSDWRTVPLPNRMRTLPKDVRGYPVFYAVMPDPRPPEGAQVDFRVLNERHHVLAYRNRLCAVCGHRLGTHLWFLGGPMCITNRIFGDGPGHEECMRYALKVCPMFSIASKAYSHRPPTDDRTEQHHDRNAILIKPQRIVLVVTKDYRMINASGGKPVFQLPPDMIAEWYTTGGEYLCRTRPDLFAQ